jgi:hypothetical protein
MVHAQRDYGKLSGIVICNRNSRLYASLRKYEADLYTAGIRDLSIIRIIKSRRMRWRNGGEDERI